MASVTKDLGIVSAYGYAKAGGYTGTEEEFQAIFNEFTEDAPGLLDRLDEAVDDAEAAEAAAVAANTAAQAAKTAAENAASTFTTDTTLTVSGKAADAKVTGDNFTQLSTAISENIYKSYPLNSASGSYATFLYGADDVPIKQLIADVKTIQSGTGEPSASNIRPFIGKTQAKVVRCGKNLCGGEVLRDAFLATGAASNNPTEKRVFYQAGNIANKTILDGKYFKPNTQYTFIFSGYGNGSRINLKWVYTDGTANAAPPVTTTKGTYAIVSAAGKTVASLSGQNQASGSYIYYEESGLFEGVLTINDYESYQGTAYTITFPTESGTVYGGVLTNNGENEWELEVTDGHIASYAGETLPSVWLSDRDVYASGTTPTTGAEVVYKLSESIKYTISADVPKTLSGLNNILADCGDITNLVYRATSSELASTIVTPEMFGAIGNGYTDDTAAIQSALNSGASTVIFGSKKTYIVSITDGSALTIPDDILIDLNNSTISLMPNDLSSYNIIKINGKQNITIKNGFIVGDYDNHTGSSGEYGHCVSIINSSNIHLSNLTVSKSWGDGIYVGSNGVGVPENVYIDSCVIKYNRRNNITAISCKNCIISKCYLGYATGTNPKVGIDIEPNSNAVDYFDGEITDCMFENNTISIFVHLTNSIPCNVKINNCSVDAPVRLYSTVSGNKIAVNNVNSSYSNGAPILVTSDGSFVNISNFIWYYNKATDSELWMIQLVGTVHNLHVDADVFIVGNAGFCSTVHMTSTGTKQNNTITCRCHSECNLLDKAEESKCVEKNEILFDTPLVLTETATLPSRGGSYIIDELDEDTSFEANTANAQKGTKYFIWNKSNYTVNFQGISQISSGHYAVFEAIDYGVVIKVADYDV